MTDPAPGRRNRILILGGGFGGAYCAQALGWRLRGTNADLLLIDRNNYFVFYPLLIEAGTGSLEPRHTVVPIRDFVRRGDFLMAEATAIDFDARELTCRLPITNQQRVLRYDQLVLALGSVTNLPPVPGLHEHGLEMKSLLDAVSLRDRAIQLLELANATEDSEERRGLLRFVVVGGNFTGIEVAGEFDEFLQRASRRYPNVARDECRMCLIEREDRILGGLSDELSDFALRHLRRRGVDVQLTTTVSEVRADHVRLSSGETLATRTVIWCAGIAPNPLIRNLDVPVDGQGYILCEPTLQVRGHERVWAIGDSAVNPDPKGRAYPATAQHAVRQGVHLAKNLAAVARGGDATPYIHKSAGSIAAIGCRSGVAQIYGLRLAGFSAWFLWRTVYLLKMPRLSRRIRVALDWTINLLFSRDQVQLGVHRLTSRAVNS